MKISDTLTRLENEVARDVQLRVTQHRTGRSPKSSHAEARLAIYKAGLEAINAKAFSHAGCTLDGIAHSAECEAQKKLQRKQRKAWKQLCGIEGESE